MKKFCYYVITLFEERIKTLAHEYINIRSSNTTLRNDIINKSLNTFYDNFVTVPIDGANSDIAIICKHFHMQLLIKELDKDNKLDANSAYEYLTNTSKEA